MNLRNIFSTTFALAVFLAFPARADVFFLNSGGGPETDPVAVPRIEVLEAQTNNYLRTEQDPVATPRVARLEGRTNAWNTAYTHSQTAHGVTGAGGFQGGNDATASGGGAVGYYATVNDGGAVGAGAYAAYGGAVGYYATAYYGGAVGSQASASYGGAVGSGAATGDGFAGGKEATTLDGQGDPIDAIQLGTGNNPNPLTLRIYDWDVLDAGGNIPLARMQSAIQTNALQGWLMFDTGSNDWVTVTVTNRRFFVFEVE